MPQLKYRARVRAMRRYLLANAETLSEDELNNALDDVLDRVMEEYPGLSVEQRRELLGVLLYCVCPAFEAPDPVVGGSEGTE